MFGLGGLIIGTPALDSENIWCYDLACPICNISSARLSIDNEEGHCTCPECGSVFDLDNAGTVLTSSSSDYRPLFRYPVSVNFPTIYIHN